MGTTETGFRLPLLVPLCASLLALVASGCVNVVGESGKDFADDEVEDTPLDPTGEPSIETQPQTFTGDDGGLAELPRSTTKQQIQYVAIPHPDDEYGSWSLIQRSPANYPVFILMTRGEQTAYCADPGVGYQPEHGERRPTPMPQARYTEDCELARTSSWHAWLDAQAELDSSLETRAEMFHAGTMRASGGGLIPTRDDAGDEIVAEHFELWVGAKSARVIFDLGDGDLQPAEVTWAIQVARVLRADFLPLSNEYGVIGASFYNASYEDCQVYTHPDHRAIHVALWNTDQGVKVQWGRTCASDPDPGRVDDIDADIHDANLRVDPDGTRRGHFQRIYGWLLGPGAWNYGETDAEGRARSRIQRHWTRQFR